MKSVRLQLMLVVLSLLLVWVAADTLLNLRALRDAFADHETEDLELVGQSVNAGLRAAMNSARKDLLHTTMQVVGENPNIVRLRLLDARGRIISSADASEIGGQTEPPPPELFANPDGLISAIPEVIGDLRTSNIYRPVRLTSECRMCHTEPEPVKAALEVSVSAEQTESMVHAVQNTLIFSSGAVFLLVGLILWFAIEYLIAKPIRDLEVSMGHVESGDFSTRARTGLDEIGRLAVRFNVMVAELEAMHRELEETHAAELERADRLATVGELAAGVAHEIKNPLAGISGAIEVIVDDLDVHDPNREVYQEVLAQIRRVDKTLRDLLSFARLSEPNISTCDLNELVHSRISLLKRSPEQQNVDLRLELAPHLPEVRIDPDQIGQILVNLCLNALHAAAPDGRVIVRTRSVTESGQVTLEVEDSGSGIPAEQLDRIFRPFFTTKAKGTGLGLSISRRIARAHQGDLTVESPISLPGARIVLHIPVLAADGGKDST